MSFRESIGEVIGGMVQKGERILQWCKVQIGDGRLCRRGFQVEGGVGGEAIVAGIYELVSEPCRFAHLVEGGHQVGGILVDRFIK